MRSRRLAQAAAIARDDHWDGVLPEVTLLAEWPEEAEAPTAHWLSNLPEDTPLAELVRLAKIRWRIEHDYRKLKHGLGLDHFEGRSWNSWHHHVTLVTAAHTFLTEQRPTPADQTDQRGAVGECADHVSAAPDFLVQPFLGDCSTRSAARSRAGRQ